MYILCKKTSVLDDIRSDLNDDMELYHCISVRLPTGLGAPFPTNVPLRLLLTQAGIEAVYEIILSGYPQSGSPPPRGLHSTEPYYPQIRLGVTTKSPSL